MPSTIHASTHGGEIEERIAALEISLAAARASYDEELRQLHGRVSRLESGAPAAPAARTRAAVGGARVPQAARPAPVRDQRAPAIAAIARASNAAVASRARQPLSDIVGGRVLAWLGGLATLIGIVLFLALAIAHGWIGDGARVLLAFMASSGLMAAGVVLHEKRGRTEASAAMVGAATAGLFATLLVATQAYALLPVALALLVAILVGALATTLAVRWAGQAVGWIGLCGGLLSPLLVGAHASVLTIALLAVVCACASAVVIRTGWAWLGLANVLLCAPQWGIWLLDGRSTACDLAVLATFSSLGLAAAVGVQARASEERLRASSATLATLSAFLTALIGRFALEPTAGAFVADAWLVVLAIAHVAVASRRVRGVTISAPLRRLLIAISVVLADVAFALLANGVVLVIGWASAGVAFAWCARRTRRESADEKLVGAGLGTHLSLTLTRALVLAPPALLGTGEAALLPMLSLALLAASCLGSAHLVGAERSPWRVALNAFGLATIAYLTAVSLGGAALVCAWALEAAVLARFARESDDVTTRLASLGFLALASSYALVVNAPPDGLVVGVRDLGGAAIALIAVAFATVRVAREQALGSRSRLWLTGAAAGTLLYLVSLAIVSAFQPTSGAASEVLLDLSVRQQGQVLLSFLWSAAGLCALIVGLKRRQPALRSAALAWLLVTVAKVFLYDLSTLTSIYRVVSFTVLGLLLFAGAFAYQRLRPPPLPDLRAAHPGQL